MRKMLRNPGEGSAVAATRAVGAPPSIPRGLFAFVVGAMERVRQRHALAELDDRLLRDIGLTRVDVWREVKKPFWRR
jgi:uncharacterized protein YjiS (DUF1127 family)